MADERDRSDFREPHLRSGDFLGAFAVVRRDGCVLMVQNAREIGGRQQRVWDLPGGGVEPGELLGETLARELLEETGLEVQGSPEFLFVQEGERKVKGRRVHAWRSFFFEVGEFAGEPRALAEVLDVCWMNPGELDRSLRAPYHDSFRTWLTRGGRHFLSIWEE
jgi:8-oxo-dGTP pyrophosphatase MutT (NUDIX family)